MDDKDRFNYKYTGEKKTGRKREYYDGVEYIPSAYAQEKRFSREPVKRTVNKSDYVEKKKKKVTANNQTGLLMGATIAVGIVICLGAFFLMYATTKPKAVRTDQTKAGIDVNGDRGDVSDEVQPIVGDVTAAGIITESKDGKITLTDGDTGDFFEVYTDGETQYKDKYGQVKAMRQLAEGELVIVSYSSVDKTAETVQSDPDAWSKTEIKNIEIDEKTKSLVIGNDTYYISGNVMFLPKGTTPSVRSADIVTLKGKGQNIHVVTVEKRTGTIEFANKDRIIDGTVEINADIYKALEEAGTIRVLEGSHTVVVKGTNIDVFIKEIEIEADEAITIDLAEAKIRQGVIDLTVSEPDYTVYVNDSPVLSEPITLSYGTYKFKVTKEGFVPWEGNVSVYQPSVAVTANLTQEVKMGRISVTTLPEGVDGSVYIDNALIGVAPVRTQVTYGSHQLTVKAPGYRDTSVEIIVEGDSNYQVTMHQTTPADNTDINIGGVSTDTGGQGASGNYNDAVTP